MDVWDHFRYVWAGAKTEIRDAETAEDSINKATPPFNKGGVVIGME